eukprot:TCALIF_01768-PA protein Name:"Similar to Tctn2 Tectonic-2 (Rattus norvegicus)" AED:0.33 eAED:0.33 QI:0/0.66/0/0.75/0.66/0.25/4/0/648
MKGATLSIQSLDSPLPSTFLQRIYPQYQDLAPCPCDLKVEQCDTGCCCDLACPENYAANFTCIPSLFGGNHSEGHFLDHNCSSILNPTEKKYFHTFLCIHSSNSPYLGHFYTEASILITQAQYDQTLVPKNLANSRDTFSFEDLGNQFLPDRRVVTYQYGSMIGTLFDTHRGIFGKLMIPRNSLNGDCVSGPIEFLKPVQSNCLQRINEDVCRSASFSLLDHRSYLSQSQSEEVSRNFGSSKTASLAVTFYRTKTPGKQMSFQYKYRKKETKGHRDTIDDILKELERKPNELKLFGGLYKFDDLDELSSNSFEEPVFFDSEVKLCSNVVLQVEYQIFWNGTSISRVKANVLLGDVDVSPVSNIQRRSLNQHFRVDFIHVNDLYKSRTIRRISGNPGYEIGAPLISGMLHNGTFKRLNQGISIWKATPSSLCRDSTLVPIGFGTNVQGGCLLQLSRLDFNDCYSLENKILNLQSALIKSQVVARGGNVNGMSESDFVPIIHDDDGTYLKSNSTFPICWIPSVLSVEILFSNSNPKPLKRIDRINGVRVVPRYEMWSWVCSELDDCNGQKSFELSVGIQFGEIPLEWHLQNTSRFWIRQHDPHCLGDNCWKQILRPFTHPPPVDHLYSDPWQRAGAIVVTILSLFILIVS